jgi:alpha-D-ribose 1-methylphosphonate 5-triphosphate diphosphatase PhnM
MWLSDLCIILPDCILERGALRIEDGHIAEIREGTVSDAEIRAPGLTVLPGLVDLHGDMLEREISPRPKASLPISLALHELDKRLVATGITTAYAAVSTEADIWTSVAVAQQRPKAWEAVHTVAEIARQRQIRIASHDDDTIEKVQFTRALGVTISEFPVSWQAAAEARRHNIHVAMGAPNALQGHSLSGNLSASEAVEAGLVDILATDYYPASMLHAAFELANRGTLELHEAVRLVSQNPADALGLHDRGRIAVGRLADLVFVDANALPRVHGVMRRGVAIYWDRFMAQYGMIRPPVQVAG